ncbi:hypothetical protein Cni_G09196 [Canna indica]|uniref:Uncharacterized protein n=1 Tax=Canna indica TaxID=4628 RepID=A0AAQ3K217_9LILI|nr:hypothetical protein Cni_G09196 [Canna indica]
MNRVGASATTSALAAAFLHRLRELHERPRSVDLNVGGGIRLRGGVSPVGPKGSRQLVVFLQFKCGEGSSSCGTV